MNHKNLFFIIIFVLIILSIIFCINNKILYNKTEIFEPGDLEININQIHNNNEILLILRTLLEDITTLFEMYHITYWIDSKTLLGTVEYEDIISFDDDANISVLLKDERKLLELIPRLNQMGYGFSQFWGGYRVYPLNGIDIKYYNRNWRWDEISKDIEDQENFNYKYPFVSLFLMNEFENDIYHYSNKYVQRVWPNHYYKTEDLFPLKKYKLNSFYVYGPNNPTYYLKRAFDKDKHPLKFKSYNQLNQTRMVPLVKFKVDPVINDWT